MKIYKVEYISFETDTSTEKFFCNKAEAKKWIREEKKCAQKVLNDPDADGSIPFFEDIDDEPQLLHLKSTKKKDIVWFINHYTEKP